MKRESEKIINYKGKSIRIRKFTPIDGGYIAQQLLTALTPFGLKIFGGVDMPVTPSQKMTKQEFADLMFDCLKYATYLQKDPIEAEIPILNDNGSIGHEDFECDDTFLLTLEVLTYNMMGFFTQDNMTYVQKMIENFTQSLKKLASTSTK